MEIDVMYDLLHCIMVYFVNRGQMIYNTAKSKQNMLVNQLYNSFAIN